MKTTALLRLLSVLLFQQFCIPIQATCYFPPEFQGEYKMQSTNSGNGVQYSVLNITANAIPIWGNCHRRIGNNFILMFNYGGESCIRCLHLKLRSKNVLQVHSSSQETISKCYTNEETAVANCPNEETIRKHSPAEIILFKTKDLEGNIVQKEYCPIDGKYTVEYMGNGRECKKFESYLDFCPSGSTMNIHFRQCTFDNYDLKLDCLGQWEGPNGQTYLALLDNRHSQDQKPQYRCALYKRNLSTGLIHMAIGKDSTCHTDLHNSTHGNEVFILMPKDEISWPPEVLYNPHCFPDWLNGNWEHVRVEDNTFTYKDHSSFKTYTIKCVGKLDSEDKYLVFAMTQCNEEQYNCMKIEKRSNNIMEFEMGTNFSRNKDVYTLCADSNFQENAWITQGRLDRQKESSCPISGEYTGYIPDTTELCAKLWSDCRAQELMYYQVSDCVTNEIYEEREYRCLDHWREAELLYTYTQRKDVTSETFECFVGSIISENKDIYIKEAGEHCQRQIDPLIYGMKLNKQGLYSCIEHIPSTYSEATTKRLSTSMSTSMSTKPWNMGAPYPTISDGGNNHINNSASGKLVYVFVLIISINVILYL